jgi:predicted dehydrogenase
MGSTHLRALRAIPGVEIAAVCSLDERALTGDLSGIQGNLGGPGERLDFSSVRKYRDPQAALAGADIDAVDICLPTNLHAETALAALRAGKHALVEKPMALDGASADRMAAEAEASGRILMTAHVLRFVPAYAALRGAVKEDGLGPARTAVFRRQCAAPGWGGWLLDPAQSGGGVFDLLIHDVDFCLHLFGPPRAVLAAGHEDLAAGIDCITAQLFYPDCAVTIVGGWRHPRAYPFSAEYTVVLEGGTVEWNTAAAAPVLYGKDGTSRGLELGGGDGYAAEIAYFVECCRAGRQAALCPPRESANAVKLMRLILEARRRNGEKIPCEL